MAPHNITKNPNYKIGESATTLSDLQAMLDKSFGGGKLNILEKYNIITLDLMKTSGIQSSEFFIYKFENEQLILLSYFSHKIFVTRSARINKENDRLQVFENGENILNLELKYLDNLSEKIQY
ncbi:MAG: hypothetical protein HRU38_04900 [Saccharospirillaceae bacterium]|nr:hypothetical protein [Pseudomonadales bacterium]NRB77995.1 hypothetical protein [Saccharospirillaceae bacterium]